MTTKLDVKDAHEMDKKVPRDLIIIYQGKPYITKAGLEWKATMLYGGGNFGVTTEIVERSEGYVLAKATFKTKDGVEFSNYGEASKANVNSMMQKQLLHLAITRAENRVLRMVTACGYVSAEEMDMNGKELPVDEKDGEPATQAQRATIKSLKGELSKEATQADAKAKIAELVQK